MAVDVATDLELMRASALLESNPAAAVRRASAILEYQPEHAEAKLLLATACRRLGDPAAATDLLATLTRTQPDSPTLQLELGRAHVVRMENAEVGTRFLRDQSQSRMAITRLFGVLQQSWTEAPEAQHPAICCVDGKMIEPPLPHIKGRAQPL